MSKNKKDKEVEAREVEVVEEVVEEEVKEEETQKRKKNILSQEDKGDYILEKRAVKRASMKEELFWELKKPKTFQAAQRLYGDDFLRAGIASLRTEGDDLLARENVPLSQEKQIAKRAKGASPEALAKIQALLEADEEARAKAGK